jgi:RNA polymerase sigma factor (sigma-70 family)
MILGKRNRTKQAEELKELYKKWPDIKRYLQTLGCKASDAEDIFQEALLIFIRKKEDKNFELTVAPFHYVKNTCKFLWYNQSRKQSKHRIVSTDDDFAEEENDEWLQKEIRLQRIEEAMSSLGKQCQDILNFFYTKGMSMIDIAKKVGLRNDKVVKAQKYRCLNKLKDSVARTEETPSLTKSFEA